jgi:phosphatidylglycerol:prolipoprotein diacylglycerol transferase
MKPNPIALSVFGYDIMWYGVLIASAMVLGIFIMYFRAERHGIDKERILDIVIFAIPAGVIGSRLYYVLANWSFYQGDIYKIIDIRSGGLAIHGGLIAGILVAIILFRRYRIRPLNGLDLAIPAVVLAQSIGRWGNYFNQEAYGSPTNLPWAINVNGVMVHPTFLYESIWCLFLFFLLSFLDKKRKFEGEIFLLYGILYSLERFFVEALRTDSLMIGSLKMAQLVSILVFVSFSFLYYYLNRKAKERY